MLSAHYFTLFLQTVLLVFAALLPVLNPIGTAIILLPFTTGIDERSRRFVAIRVARNTLMLLSVVMLAGSTLLAFFGISVPVVQTAGGLVLASMGWKLLNADDRLEGDKAGASRPGAASLEEQTFYPFTFPVSVGPGSVAVTLTLSAHTQQATWLDGVASVSGALLAFVGLAGLVYLSVAYTVSLLHRVGPSGTRVVMRLMAFIILCIGAQICWSGVSTLLLQLKAGQGLAWTSLLPPA